MSIFIYFCTITFIRYLFTKVNIISVIRNFVCRILYLTFVNGRRTILNRIGYITIIFPYINTFKEV